MEMKKLLGYLGTRWVAICWTILILILMCIPGNMIPQEQKFFVPDFDKLVHAGLFGILVWLWCLYYRRNLLPGKRLARIFFYVFLISGLYGFGTEFLQKYVIPMRDYDNVDIIADLVGAAIGYGICNIRLLF
jgi:VanZ family protein